MILKINSESLYFKDEAIELGVMMHAYNPSTQETEAGGLRIQGQPGLHNKTLSKNPPSQKEKDDVTGNHTLINLNLIAL
jgi:hypothetical protein